MRKIYEAIKRFGLWLKWIGAIGNWLGSCIDNFPPPPQRPKVGVEQNPDKENSKHSDIKDVEFEEIPGGENGDDSELRTTATRVG